MDVEIEWQLELGTSADIKSSGGEKLATIDRSPPWRAKTTCSGDDDERKHDWDWIPPTGGTPKNCPVSNAYHQSRLLH